MKLENFKIKAPNFAIHDIGTFALADLDDDDFDRYQNEFGCAISNRRREQIKQREDDASSELDAVGGKK